MRCEVLAFKPVQKGRVAVVRIVEHPDVIGEIPVHQGSTVERGQVAELKTRVQVQAGRIMVIPYVA